LNYVYGNAVCVTEMYSLVRRYVYILQNNVVVGLFLLDLCSFFPASGKIVIGREKELDYAVRFRLFVIVALVFLFV
jgi:hypothetical protein